MEQSKTGNPILDGVIWKQILFFFIPVALGTFFQQMYNTVDALVVGNAVGMDALSAVGGATGSLINLIIGFFVGVASGATVAVAQCYGAGKREEISRVVHTTAAMSLAAGAMLTVAGILLSPAALRFLNQPEELMADSVLYLRVYFAGMLPTLIYNVGASILRAVGDSRRPMIYLIVCCAVNTVLDLLFVAVLKLGVLGAALATVLAQVVSALLVLLRLLRTDDVYRLDLRRIRFHRKENAMILRVGIPAGLQSLMYNVSGTFNQAKFNTFGTDVVAAWTVLGKVDGLSWLIIGAFGISVTTFVGQNYGAGRLDRVKRSIYVSAGMTFIFTILFSVFVITCGRPLYMAFGARNAPAVMEIGKKMLWLIGPFYSLFVPIEILSGAMRGVGKTVVPTAITGIGVCLLRVVWTIVVCAVAPSYELVVLSYPVSWLIASIAYLIYYKWGHWLTPPAGSQLE